ncbi:hypothetical protein Leryth_016409 [Lithospermum erythrorhizon]|nr:hypothetical protein Leryth_016409 [Lithospermum erythrorhizon]
MSENCNSRHFSWLMKSCFPNNQQTHQPCPLTTSISTTLASLPDDLLLECLCRVPNSTLPVLSLVCHRWALLLDSPSFHHLRLNHHLITLTIFSISISNSSIFAACHHLLPSYSSWKISSFSPKHQAILESGSFYSPFSSPRLASIGRKIYIIGTSAMLQCDSWTGTVTQMPGTLIPRKKFAAAAVAGKLYVAGGCPRSLAVEEFDPEMNTWRVVCDAPKKRYGCIGASIDGILYVIGGLRVGTAADEARVEGPPHVYASTMDLYDVEGNVWLRSRSVPTGGCVVAATAAAGHIYILSSHAVDLSFWKFNASRKCPRFGEWDRIKTPPLAGQVRLDSTVRFSCIGVGEKVVLVQVMGCIDDILRRSGRAERGFKEGLVLVYDCAAGEWSRGVDMPEVIRRPTCVCVEC